MEKFKRIHVNFFYFDKEKEEEKDIDDVHVEDDSAILIIIKVGTQSSSPYIKNKYRCICF